MHWLYKLISKAKNGYSSIGYLYGESDNYKEETCKPSDKPSKLACFDLDQTLINTASGKQFPISIIDWKWMYSNTVETLAQFNKQGYKIIIITNQATIKDDEKKLEEFKQKIELIEEEINKTNFEISFRIFCAPHKDIHRKPYPTFLENMNIDRKYSFYCGDGAGRKTLIHRDHTSADIYFAYNLRMVFRTPEYIFLKDSTSYGNISYPIKLDLHKTTYEYKINPENLYELIIMVGFPGSGKSTITKTIVEYHNINGRDIENVSLDTLKSRTRMISIIRESAYCRKTIIIDNTNLSIEKRKELIDIVKKIDKTYYVRIIHVNTTIERCKHNNLYRYYVNWNNDPKLINDMVYRIMAKQYEKPLKTESKFINQIDEVNETDLGPPLDPRYFLYLL